MASTLSILRNDSLYNNTAIIAWLAWFSEQFSTNLLLLPVLLAAPRLKQLLRLQINWQLRASMPLLALLFSLVFSVYIGGPGAIAFPIPALLWCAVRYQLFTVTLLTLLTGMTEISSISANLMLYETPNNHNAYLNTLMSARLGIAMLVMGPLILSSSIAVNRKLLRRLEHSANHDFLTGVLARNALTRKAGEMLEHKYKSKEAVSLLLIDIDHLNRSMIPTAIWPAIRYWLHSPTLSGASCVTINCLGVWAVKSLPLCCRARWRRRVWRWRSIYGNWCKKPSCILVARFR